MIMIISMEMYKYKRHASRNICTMKKFLPYNIECDNVSLIADDKLKIKNVPPFRNCVN